MEPVVSVVIPTKNRPGPLASALESVAAQTLTDPGSAHRIEVIVVNDGGTGVGDVVKESGLDNVKLIESPDSHGHSAARNTGIDAAEGQYIAFLDDDDLYLPEHLETALSTMRATGADLVYAHCRISDRRVEPGEVPARTEHAFDVAYDSAMLLVCNYIPTSTIVCRNDRAARFDPTIPVLVDWELLLRLVHGHGWKVASTDRPTVVYHRIADQSSDTVDAVRIVEGHDRYRQGYPALLDQWPVPPTSPIAALRQHMMDFNNVCHERLVRGEPLPHFLYEQALRVLHSAHTGRIDVAEVPTRLLATLG
ncbi:glycosyltransferase family 2 protein [Allokutzneria oryzae]|uniref:Glycosyltransferase family 2 protein n=1 Tax=Allokutzneria oryzae TaxID=1378989 RepID=A0ABV5ZRG5_9PSEU